MKMRSCIVIPLKPKALYGFRNIANIVHIVHLINLFIQNNVLIKMAIFFLLVNKIHHKKGFYLARNKLRQL